MTAKQGALIALVSLMVTLFSIGFLFSFTWGKAEQKLVDISITLKSHGERLLYLERK